MSNEVPPANPGSPATTPAGSSDKGASPAATGVDPQKFVSREEHEAILKRLDSQSAIINRLEKEVKTKPVEPPKPLDPSKPVEPAELVTKVKELDDKMARLDSREQRLTENAIHQSIKGHFLKIGMDESQAARFAKLVQNENKGQFTVTESEDGTLVPKAGTESVESWMNAYLQTDQGRVLLPTKPNPRIPASNLNVDPNAGKIRIARADLQSGNYDPKVMKAGGYIVTD